ncbi:hypothetical protein ACQ4M3_40185 [Leptolyngbya sp. AN03gr2]|uniref:hypothetical protein n=1 Tax=unclassified Leptolyngbya TaxID=2650499 RepID=UPI003D319795
MNALHQRMIRLPETRYLLLGISTAYLIFVLNVGIRPIVFLVGAGICLMTLLAWYWQIRQMLMNSATDLLQTSVFLNYVNAFDQQIPPAAKVQWKPFRQGALKIQHLTTQIAQHDITLVPDLLETLHTIVALLEKTTQTLQASQQIKTNLAQQQTTQTIQNCATRLQESYLSLQEIHDQLALKDASQFSVALAQLQILIATNQTFLTEL